MTHDPHQPPVPHQPPQRPHQPPIAHQNPAGARALAWTAPAAPLPRLALSVWTWPGCVVVAWAALALVGGVIVLLYLGLGTAMTNTLDGVFSPDDPGLVFNWVMLLIALIGQLLGLACSLVVLALAIRDRRRAERRATPALVLGIVACAAFLLLGLIQLPLVGIFREALPIMTG